MIVGFGVLYIPLIRLLPKWYPWAYWLKHKVSPAQVKIPKSTVILICCLIDLFPPLSGRFIQYWHLIYDPTMGLWVSNPHDVV